MAPHSFGWRLVIVRNGIYINDEADYEWHTMQLYSARATLTKRPRLILALSYRCSLGHQEHPASLQQKERPNWHLDCTLRDWPSQLLTWQWLFSSSCFFIAIASCADVPSLCVGSTKSCAMSNTAVGSSSRSFLQVLHSFLD